MTGFDRMKLPLIIVTIVAAVSCFFGSLVMFFGLRGCIITIIPSILFILFLLTANKTPNIRFILLASLLFTAFLYLGCIYQYATRWAMLNIFLYDLLDNLHQLCQTGAIIYTVCFVLLIPVMVDVIAKFRFYKLSRVLLALLVLCAIFGLYFSSATLDRPPINIFSVLMPLCFLVFYCQCVRKPVISFSKKPIPPTADIPKGLTSLKNQCDMGLISREDYDRLREEVLNSI